MNLVLYRNVRARDLLDAFFVSAVACVLLVRFYLYLTGYPQIGGGSLHIAHMLYGGIFMLVAIVMSLAFLGNHARQISAVVGGIGFGLFIDELGKFITKDNDYFFRPTIGIIYAIFVALYLTFNFLTRHQRLTSREYQLNALNELEEAIAQDLDRQERAHIHALLAQSNRNSVITKQLQVLVDNLSLSARTKPSKLAHLLNIIDNKYRSFWKKRNSHLAIRLIFIAEIVVLTTGIVLTIYSNIDDLESFLNDGTLSYGREFILAQVATSVIAAGFLLYGLTQLASSRYEAFEQFRRATLINIYLTQFFIFIRVQFDALPGLIVNIILLLLITFVLRQEKRLGKTDAIN